MLCTPVVRSVETQCCGYSPVCGLYLARRLLVSIVLKARRWYRETFHCGVRDPCLRLQRRVGQDGENLRGRDEKKNTGEHVRHSFARHIHQQLLKHKASQHVLVNLLSPQKGRKLFFQRTRQYFEASPLATFVIDGR